MFSFGFSAMLIPLFVLKAAINNEICRIANIYGPNKDADVVKFYRNQLSKLLTNDEFGNEENINIVGGNFNCPLDITLDKKDGLPIPRKYAINSIDEYQNEFSLHDIWRLKNLTLQSFTWGRCPPFIFCRLDYWLISDKLPWLGWYHTFDQNRPFRYTSRTWRNRTKWKRSRLLETKHFFIGKWKS